MKKRGFVRNSIPICSRGNTTCKPKLMTTMAVPFSGKVLDELDETRPTSRLVATVVSTLLVSLAASLLVPPRSVREAFSSRGDSPPHSSLSYKRAPQGSQTPDGALMVFLSSKSSFDVAPPPGLGVCTFGGRICEVRL